MGGGRRFACDRPRSVRGLAAQTRLAAQAQTCSFGERDRGVVEAGDVLRNPLSGEIFIIRKTSADTNGRRFQMETRVHPQGGTHIPAHIHPCHRMRLSIKQGRMFLWLGDPKSERPYEAGDEITVPIVVPYNWRPAGSQQLRFVTEFRPAGDWEKLFESMCAIGRAASKNELNGGLASICVLNNFSDHMYLAGHPTPVQKALFKAVAFFARLIGYRGYYPY